MPRVDVTPLVTKTIAMKPDNSSRQPETLRENPEANSDVLSLPDRRPGREYFCRAGRLLVMISDGPGGGDLLRCFDPSTHELYRLESGTTDIPDDVLGELRHAFDRGIAPQIYPEQYYEAVLGPEYEPVRTRYRGVPARIK